MKAKRGQITVYVIIAIILVVAALLFFILKGSISEGKIPESVEPVETAFVSCLEEKAWQGIKLMETHGGYIYQPEYVAGSRYHPYSSKLSFMGTQIPYWYYINSANMEESQIPSKENMQTDLGNFLEKGIETCSLYQLGYNTEMGDVKVNVKISENYVDFDVEGDLVIKGEFGNYVVGNHDFRVDSSLGYLYDYALNVYNKEKNEYFIEDYSIDVMRSYLPVDGVELSCSPLFWNGFELYQSLTENLQTNLNSFSNLLKSDNYFSLDFSKDVALDFVYFSDWPTYFEVNPSEGELLRASPIGNQAGLSILGFCYVPYHFVYNIRHPLLIQVEKNSEIFQFPIVVVIDGNIAKEGKQGKSYPQDGINICSKANNPLQVSVYGPDLESVDGEVSFECFGSVCEMGKTENGILNAVFPQCANGMIHVKADGYSGRGEIVSTVGNESIVVILDKEKDFVIELFSDRKDYGGKGIINFESEDDLITVVYPENSLVSLSSGEYNVSVILYTNSSLDLGDFNSQYCYDVPKEGILGLAGFETEECINVTSSEELLSSVVIGGGEASKKITNNDVSIFSRILIDVGETNIPENLNDVQNNYLSMETNVLEVSLQ